MSVDGDSHPPNRESQLRTRLAEMLTEVEAILKELRGQGSDEDSPEKRRKAFRVIKGGLILVLIGAVLGMASAAGWAGKHVRTVAGAAVTVGAAGVIAGALLAQGSAPPPRHGSVGPIPRPHATASATAASPSPPPIVGASPSAPHRPGRTLPPPLVAVPSRVRRPSGAPLGAAPSPAGPSPTPSRPAPSPTGSPPPPPPFSCPAGLVLQVVGIGVYVCV